MEKFNQEYNELYHANLLSESKLMSYFDQYTEPMDLVKRLFSDFVGIDPNNVFVEGERCYIKEFNFPESFIDKRKLCMIHTYLFYRYGDRYEPESYHSIYIRNE